MITKHKCHEEIEKLLAGPMTPQSAEMLATLYTICDHMGKEHEEHDDHNADHPLDRRSAEKWAAHMVNEDGSRGPHWSMSQTEQVRALKGSKATAEEWYAVMNSIYSDYAGVAKKYGLLGNTDFFADMTAAWLADVDAVHDKAARYYHNVVKH